METADTSRVFTVTFPPELAERAELLAKEEGRTISELFTEAFRTYQEKKWDKFFEEIAEYAETCNPHGYTVEDVPRLIKEVRAEERAKKERAEQLALSRK